MARTPDKTSEVDGADILSVAEASTEDATLEIERSAPPAPPASAPRPASIAPPRSLRPPASFDLPFLPPPTRDPFGPASTRPSASPPAIVAPETHAPIESTVQIRKAAGIPGRGLVTTRVALLAACAAVGGLIAVVVVAMAPKAHVEPAPSAAPVVPATSVEEGEPALPESAPIVDPDVAAAPAPKRSHAKAVVKPGPGRTSSDRIGVLRVPMSVRGVLVDGAPQRVVGGALFLACGAHRIKTPTHASRTVDVPCGRTVFL